MDYFTSKIDKLMSEIPRPTEDPTKILREALENWEGAENRDIFKMVETSEAAIRKIISTLGNSTACGHNTIDMIAIKNASDILAGPIAHVTNLSIRNADFADS